MRMVLFLHLSFDALPYRCLDDKIHSVYVSAKPAVGPMLDPSCGSRSQLPSIAGSIRVLRLSGATLAACLGHPISSMSVA